jgi:hypothetical protein
MTSGLRKNVYERIAEEEKRQADLGKIIADLKARAKILDRKLDTRRKIIMGAAVQAHAKLNGRFREELRKAILAAVTRPQDRAVLPEFFASHQTAPTPTARPPGTGESPAGKADLAGTHPPERTAPAQVLPALQPDPAAPPRPLTPQGKPPSGAAPA